MKACTKFFALPFREKYVLLEAVLAVLAAEMALRILSLQTIVQFLQQNKSQPAGIHGFDMEQPARFVDIADRNMPGNSSCLRRAVALAYCFRRRGIWADLCIGVHREHDRLCAHAWVQAHNGAMFGESDEPRYSLLSGHSPFGQSLRRKRFSR